MRRIHRTNTIGIVMLVCLAVAATASGQGEDRFSGRWEGVLLTESGRTPATVTFRLAGETYTGAISALQGGGFLPFKEVRVGRGKIGVLFQADSAGNVMIAVDFVLSGDGLRGKGRVMGKNATPASFSYELRRIPEETVTANASGEPTSQQELDDFDRLHQEVDLIVKKRLIDEFERKHPASGLLPFVFQEGFYLAKRFDNYQMMTFYAEKSLKVRPKNTVLLTDLAGASVQRGEADKAERLASDALEILNHEKDAVPLPDRLRQERIIKLEAANLTTLGYVHLRRAQPGRDSNLARKALARFNESLRLNPIDDFTLYGLGYCFAILNDYPNAESFLAKAAALDGTVSRIARTLLETIYRQRNNTLEGLEGVIAKAKSDLDLSKSPL